MDKVYFVAIITLLLATLAFLGMLIVWVWKMRKDTSAGGDSETLKAECETTRRFIKERTEDALKVEGELTRQSVKDRTDAMKDGINATNQQMLEHAKSVAEGSEKRYAELRDTLEKSLQEIKTGMETELTKVREDNKEQLDKMREVVDEKLTKTLNERLSQNFSAISERLDSVHKNLGEIQSLSKGMTDLNKTLGNIKTRGTWAEVALESLLEEILQPAQYERQSSLGGRSNGERVDFAILMPGKGDEKVFLPVDVKFPMEDYARLQAAAEAADKDAVKAAQKALEDTVRLEGKSISDKYIKPPRTTNFAVMYLPTEGLYSEVIKSERLTQALYKMNVMPAGPTSFTALLSGLQQGFQSLQIQKESVKVFEAFRGIQRLMEQFNKDLALIQKSLEKATEGLQKVTGDSNRITSKLNGVQFPERMQGEISEDEKIQNEAGESDL